MSAAGIAARARSDPDRLALADSRKRLTWSMLDARVNQAARALRARGVRPSDRVAIALANRVEFLEAAAAAARLGADVVPLSWRFKRDETRHVALDSQSRVVLAEDGARDATDGLAAIPLGEWERLVAAQDASPVEGGAPEPAPVTFRYYTSGTTGRPKAIERPRPEPASYAEGVRSYAAMYGVADPDGVHLACGPLYHTAPCAFANYALLLGQTVVVLERFDARECLRAIERERVTWSHMVPVNFVRILAAAGAGERPDLSSLRRVLHAAAPCPPAVKRRIMALFGPGVVWEYYGMTEGIATFITDEEWLAKPGSVGRPVPGITVRILDEEGRECPAGQTGIVYCSPTGARFSYAGDPDKTRDAWRGDLFTVGDMGHLDQDGYLFLTDRRQDMIITGGANVYPAEVEAVLHEHPAVEDVAVIGVPDEEYGERVLAIVQPRAATAASDLIAFARERLTHYKCPREVTLVERLPRDENGKVRKRELREPYWAGRDRRI